MQQPDNPENKMCFRSITIETTRKCNLKCKHCYRGDAQNLTIKKEYIDKLFSQIKGVRHVFITGGEPLLAIDELEYICQKVKENGNVLGVSLISNGTILSERVANILNNLALWIHNRWKAAGVVNDDICVGLSISNTEYHINDVNAAINFYRSRTNQWVEVKRNYKDVDTITFEALSASGRAKNLKHCRLMKVDTSYRIDYGKDIDKDEFFNEKKQIVIDEEIITHMCLGANGSLGIVGCQSYEDEEKNKIGDILVTPICEMIEKWNQTHFLTKKEIRNILKSEYAITYFVKDDDRKTEQAKLNIRKNILAAEAKIRQNIYNKNPTKPYKNIIEEAKAINAICNLANIFLRE